MIEGEFDAGGAGLARLPQLLHRFAAHLGDIFDVGRKLLGVFHVTKDVGGHAAVRIGANDVRFQTDGALDRELLDEARDGLDAFVRTGRHVRDRKSQVRDQREGQGPSLAQVLAQVFDVDLTLAGRVQRRGLACGGLPHGLPLVLVDDEPDLVEPALEDVDAREFHHAFGVHLQRLPSTFSGEESEILGAELLLQGGEIGLHAPTGAIIDEHETITVIDPTTGRRTQDDAAALIVGLFLKVGRLDQLTKGESADDVEEAYGEESEDRIQTEAVNRRRGEHLGVSAFPHGRSRAGGTPSRSMTAFCVKATGTKPRVPTTPASRSCPNR